jgi:hypothetical protein
LKGVGLGFPEVQLLVDLVPTLLVGISSKRRFDRGSGTLIGAQKPTWNEALILALLVVEPHPGKDLLLLGLDVAPLHRCLLGIEIGGRFRGVAA